jgi:hypothetical protein
MRVSIPYPAVGPLPPGGSLEDITESASHSSTDGDTFLKCVTNFVRMMQQKAARMVPAAMLLYVSMDAASLTHSWHIDHGVCENNETINHIHYRFVFPYIRRPNEPVTDS